MKEIETMFDEFDTKLYSYLCDYCWHKETGEPENDILDTSPRCREFATIVMDTWKIGVPLGVDPRTYLEQVGLLEER